MIGFKSIVDAGESEASALLWTGRSGRRYRMTLVGEAGAAMAPETLYALEDEGVIGWAGTAEDLIGDHASRARFRRLSALGARLFSLVTPADPLTMMTLVWDLEGSRHYAGRSAA
ncbi:hypothetical protein [Pelagibacterium mangrovi]|uniref:hypothetical protein n=1 Tax=Pelagibacterium mangrovi TaxID=3119828 RepID=UPI002FC84FA5